MAKPSTSKRPKAPSPSRTRRPASLSQPSPLSESVHDRIEKRAYENYQGRIRQGALDDWLKAEREILQHTRAGKSVLPHRGGYTGEEQE